MNGNAHFSSIIRPAPKGVKTKYEERRNRDAIAYVLRVHRSGLSMGIARLPIIWFTRVVMASASFTLNDLLVSRHRSTPITRSA